MFLRTTVSTFQRHYIAQLTSLTTCLVQSFVAFTCTLQIYELSEKLPCLTMDQMFKMTIFSILAAKPLFLIYHQVYILMSELRSNL